MFSTCRRGILQALFLAVAFAPAAGTAQAQSVGVTLRIHIDADSMEVLRAWRRAQGLEPPDAEADRRVREAAERRAAERMAANSPEAARERRRARTVELVDTPQVQYGY